MPVYVYAALSDRGVLTTGEKAAVSAQRLRDELTAQGLLVQKIRPKGVGLRLPLPSFGGAGRVKPEHFLLFNQEFIALIRAGLTIPDALTLAAKRPEQPALGSTLTRVLEDVRVGVPLSEACANHPDVFDGLYLSALRTGEKTGDLVKVLARYQDYLKQKVALRKKIGRAMAYPVFLLIALAVILGVLFTFVLPRFVAMYADFGAELPFATGVLVGIVDNFVLIGPAVVGVAIAIGALLRRWRQTEAGRLQLDTIKERLPYFGSIARTLAIAQLARSLATLLGGGTPLVQALDTTQAALTNRAVAARLKRATEQVMGGVSLAQAMQVANLMPETAIKMIEVGEATGGLEQMLDEVAQFYQDMLEHRLERVMSLVEPLMMLLMGVLIGGIIIIMYLPIFNMADIIK